MRLRGDIPPNAGEGLNSFNLEANRHFVRQNAGRLALVERLREKHGLFFLNAQRIFDNEEDSRIYLDNCHNTEYGLSVLAAAIEDFLTQRGLLPSPP